MCLSTEQRHPHDRTGTAAARRDSHVELAGLRLAQAGRVARRPPHVHLACTECYLVPGGAGQLHALMRDGSQRIPLREGDAVVFTPGTIHCAVNDDDLRVQVIMQNGGLPEAGDAARTRTANRPITRSVRPSFAASSAENTAPTSAPCSLKWLSMTELHGQNHGQIIHSGQSAVGERQTGRISLHLARAAMRLLTSSLVNMFSLWACRRCPRRPPPPGRSAHWCRSLVQWPLRPAGGSPAAAP